MLAGRKKKFDEKDSLEKAAALFWSNGYEATTLDDLLESMKIKKSSFYNTYGSKEKLFLRTVNLHHQKSFDQFEQLLKQTSDEIGLLKSLFLQFAEGSTLENSKGCYAGNIIVELNQTNNALTNGAKNYLLKLENIFSEIINRAKENGKLNTQVDTRILAQSLLTLWNGINITRRIRTDKQQLRSLIDYQLKILE